MTDFGAPPGPERESLQGEPTYPPPTDPGYGPYRPAGGYYSPYPYPYAYPPARANPLQGLAIATQVLLGVQLAGYLGLILVLVREHSLIGRVETDPTSVRLQDLQSADDAAGATSVVVLLLLVATAVVWIIWFYRARTNVEAWSTRFQRFPKGWAIGGWLCPVVNLWIPYQIAGDILDDTEQPAGGPRRTDPLLTAWWIGWAASFIIAILVFTERNPASIDGLSGYIVLEMVGIGLRIVTGVLAILVVARITKAQTRRLTGR